MPRIQPVWVSEVPDLHSGGDIVGMLVEEVSRRVVPNPLLFQSLADAIDRDQPLDREKLRNMVSKADEAHGEFLGCRSDATMAAFPAVLRRLREDPLQDFEDLVQAVCLEIAGRTGEEADNAA